MKATTSFPHGGQCRSWCHCVCACLQVAGDLSGSTTAWFSQQVLALIVERTCGRLSQKAGQFKDHAPLPHLTGIVLTAVEQHLSAETALISTHAHLLSLLATLVTLDPSLERER